MNAAIVTVGDELLTGDAADTIASRPASRVDERGVTVERVESVEN